MEKNIMKQSFSPVVLLFCVWLVFALPYVLLNRVPFASDYQVNHFAPWSAYPAFWGPVKNGAMPDVIGQIYPWKYFTIQTLKQGELPLWNPYSFSGTNHLANYQSAVLSPLNLLFFVFSFIDGWTALILLQPLLAGVFMYLFMRRVSVGQFGSLVSSVSFMFCGFLTVWMAYGTLGYAMVFLPLALFAVRSFFVTTRIRYVVLVAASVPLSFFSGHFQTSIYFFLFVLAFTVFSLIIAKDIKRGVFVCIFLVFGLLLSLPQILPSMEAYGQSLRSTLFEKGEAIPLAYLPTLISPDFLGNPVTRNDWFGHYAEWNGYAGVLPFMLALYTLRKRTSLTFFFMVTAFVSLLLSLQTPLLDGVISLRIPVLSTSAASRIIVLFSFSVAVLAGFGFSNLLSDISKRNDKAVVSWIVLFLLIFCVLWTVVLGKIGLPHDKVSIARSNLAVSSYFFSVSIGIILVSFLRQRAVIILVSGLFVLGNVLFLYRSPQMLVFFQPVFIFLAFIALSCVIGISWIAKKVREKKIAFISWFLFLVVAFDMLRFTTKWMPFDPKERVFVDVPVSASFKNISGYQRVIGNLGAEAGVYYTMPLLEGYDAVYIRRYGQFIASSDDGKLKDAARSVVLFPKRGKYAKRVMDLLGVSYVVHKVSDGRQSWAFPYWEYPEGTFRLVSQDSEYEIFTYTHAYPRAFLVGDYDVVDNPQDILDSVFSPSFDLRKKVILEKDPGVRRTQKPIGTASIVSYRPTRISLDVEASSSGLLFLSDPFYPGWKALVDGKETSVYRANYALRAIPVAKGRHSVVFLFQPQSFSFGVIGFAVGLSGLGLISLRLRKAL